MDLDLRLQCDWHNVAKNRKTWFCMACQKLHRTEGDKPSECFAPLAVVTVKP